jgi:hypothetical protein
MQNQFGNPAPDYNNTNSNEQYIFSGTPTTAPEPTP